MQYLPESKWHNAIVFKLEDGTSRQLYTHLCDKLTHFYATVQMPRQISHPDSPDFMALSEGQNHQLEGHMVEHDRKSLGYVNLTYFRGSPQKKKGVDYPASDAFKYDYSNVYEALTLKFNTFAPVEVKDDKNIRRGKERDAFLAFLKSVDTSLVRQ